MKVAFHPDAEGEFLDALGYYESCQPGLAQLPQLRGYFWPNLLISHDPIKKVVTTNFVFCIFLAGSV
jgi:hypothetical protein